MPRDPRALIAIERSAYQPGEDTVAWAAALTQSFGCAFDGSLGAVGRVLDLVERRPRRGYLLHECRPHIERGLSQQQRVSANRQDLVAHGRGLRRLCTGRLPPELAEDPYVLEMQRGMREQGVEDMFHLTATDGASVAVTVGAMVPLGSTLPATASRWAQVASHFDAGLRVQLRVEALRRVLGAAAGEVVATMDGDLVDVGRGAQTGVLRARLRAIAAERSARSRDAEEIWRGVVAGRWSVIDRHDHDGRRYLVAIPLDGDVAAPRVLSERERAVAALAAEGHSDKWIAYTLGVARSTVATQLASALEKLGLESRVELASLFRSASGR